MFALLATSSIRIFFSGLFTTCFVKGLTSSDPEEVSSKPIHLAGVKADSPVYRSKPQLRVPLLPTQPWGTPILGEGESVIDTETREGPILIPMGKYYLNFLFKMEIII